VDKLVLTACLLHNLIIDKEGIDETAVQKISSNTAKGGASVIRGPRRYNRATREAYNIRGPLISSTIKSTPVLNDGIGFPYL
jgi:hypothetical protein